MRLKELREDRDIRQKEIAEYLHIRQNTYSQYETEQRQLPIDVLIALAKFYQTSTDYLLGLTNNPLPYGCSAKAPQVKLCKKSEVMPDDVTI